jgi:hypothetical protein
MIAFDVSRNDKRLFVAGVGGYGVLTAMVSWVAHPPEKLAQWMTDGIVDPETGELNLQVGGLQVGGLKDNLHMRWIDKPLRVGDEIRIHVIDASRVDTATTEYRDDPVKDIEAKKAYVRRLAKELDWEIREA